MNIPEMMPDNLILIGNGFDLAHGLPTAYSDFRQYICDRFVVDQNSDTLVPQSEMDKDGGIFYDEDEVASYIVQVIDQVGGENWGDLETCLGADLFDELKYDLRDVDFDQKENDIGNDIDVNGQLSEGLCYTFEEMKRLFFTWVKDRLGSLDYSGINSPGTGNSVVSRNKTFFSDIDLNRTLFLNFNYTPTLQTVYQIPEATICAIHGTVKSPNKEILFGHGNKSDVADQMVREMGAEDNLSDLKEFLCKDTEHAIARHADFFNQLGSVRNIYSYGFSFSDADRIYLDTIEEYVKPVQTTWYLNDYDKDNAEYRKLLTIRGYTVDVASW